MINLQKIFGSSCLHTLPDNYKKSHYNALLSFLKSDDFDNQNLISLYELLLKNNIVDLSAYLSTFFYALVKQKACTESASADPLYDLLLFLLAFDSLYSLLNDGGTFLISCPCEINLLLPRTGINLILSQHAYIISKNGNTITLNNTQDNSTYTYIITNDYKITDGLSVLKLDESNSLYQNIIRHQISYDLIVDSAFDNYLSKLNQAILRLQNIDDEFSHHLQHIEFIMPMAFIANDITKSFTLSGLPHVLFLSDCHSVIQLMENLIHESLHDELNIFMNYYDLILAENNYYYSSWRNDPRPIRGLLHALYVFTGIFNFYSKWLHETTLVLKAEEKNFIIMRYSLIYYELGLAFCQLEHDSSELTELGIHFLHALKSIYKDSCSSYIYPDCPASILEHIEDWKKTNRSYKAYMPSQDFFSWKNQYAKV